MPNSPTHHEALPGQAGAIASRAADEQTFRHVRVVFALRNHVQVLLGCRKPVSEVACHPGWPVLCRYSACSSTTVARCSTMNGKRPADDNGTSRNRTGTCALRGRRRNWCR